MKPLPKMRSFLKVCLVSHSHQYLIWGIPLSLNHTRPFHSMLIHALVLFNHATLLLNILTLSSHLSFLQHKTPWSPYLTWTRPIEPINVLSLSLRQTDKRFVIPILHTRDGRLLSTAKSYQPYAFWNADKNLYHRSKSLYSTLTLWSVLEQTDGGDGGGLESQRLSDMCILMWDKTGERSYKCE